MSEEQIHNAESTAPEGDPQKRRRRRGNRGGRGRGRSRPAVDTAPNARAAESGGDDPPHEKSSLEAMPRAQRESEAESSIETEGPESSLEHEIDRERAERPEPPTKPPLSQHQRPAPRPHQPRPPTKPATSEQISSAVGEAIEEVYRITEVLKRVLEDLDELLETLELAERQKLEDERELDSLRRAVRQLTPRSHQQPSHRQDQPAPRGPQRHPERPQERHRGTPTSPPQSSREATEQSSEDDAVPPQS